MGSIGSDPSGSRKGREFCDELSDCHMLQGVKPEISGKLKL